MEQGVMDNKIVLVVGGAEAPSAGVVDALLQSGATVIVPVPNGTAIQKLRQSMKLHDAEKLITYPTDFSDYERAEELIDIIVSAYGHIDLVVAAVEKIAGRSPLLYADIKEWQKAMDCSMTTSFVIDRLCLPLLGKNGGVMINITNADHLLPGYASPLVRLLGIGGIELSKVFAEEARQRKIHYYHLLVNNIAPVDPATLQEGEREITAEMVGAEVVRLYHTHPAISPQIFHFFTGKEIDSTILNRLQGS